MMETEAFHLPGLRPDDVKGWRTLERDGLTLRFPVLDQHGFEHICDALRAARARTLEGRSAAAIVNAVAEAATTMREDAARDSLESDIAIMSSYAPQMVHHVLERMLQDWTRPALSRLLDAELDGGRALETFQAQRSRGVRSRAFGPDLTLHVFAGNVPGVAVMAMIRSLLVRSAVLGKMASGEPILATWFARVLARVDPELAACIGVTYWPGEDGQSTDHAMRHADTVVVYGGANAARAIRERVPGRVRIIEHGPRFSIGVVSRHVLASAVQADRVADDIARAVAMFDQQGCVSPHAVWVEEGGAIGARALAERIARALALLERELPAGKRTAGEAVGVHDARARAEFRAVAGEDTRVWASADTSWTVICDDVDDFQPSPLSRTLRVHAVPALDDVPHRIAHAGAFLQTVAIAADPATTEALAPRFARIGATRITNFAQMPWPPVAGHHDGRGPLSELVRWVDLEVE